MTAVPRQSHQAPHHHLTAVEGASKQERQAVIEQALAVLVEPGSVFEVRILGALKNKKAICAGWFDDTRKAAAAILRYDGRAKGVYVTLNPTAPALLARAHNRIEEWAKETTADTGITARRWLLVDCDAVRPAGISSSEAEHQAALERAAGVREWLTAQGWPAPVEADSGNGAHLLYRIELPNDDASKRLVEAALKALHQRFSDDAVNIDTGVHNASRITKVYGTLVRKGDSTPERPHRRARLLAVPEQRETVQHVQLAALAATLNTPAPAAAAASAPASTGASGAAAPAPDDEPAKVRAALAALHSSRWDDYTQWIAIGHALKNWDGPGARELWERHSSASAKHQDSDGARWDTFKPNTITIASVFHWADEDAPGWRKARVGGNRRKQRVHQARAPQPSGEASEQAETEPVAEGAPASVEAVLALLPDEGASVEAVYDAALDAVEVAARLRREDVARIGKVLRKRGLLTQNVREWMVSANEARSEYRREQRKQQASEQEQISVLKAAREWAAEHRDFYAYDGGHKQWRKWTGTHWHAEPDDSTELYDSIGDWLEGIGAGNVNTERKVHDALRFARGGGARLFELRGKIAFRNGTLDTSTGELLPHDRADGLTTCLPYDYEPEGSAPTIDRVLRELFVLPQSDEVIRCHIGMALLRDTTFHKVPFIIGQPGGGKSTLLELVALALGLNKDDYAPGHIFAANREGSLERVKRIDNIAVLIDELPSELLDKSGLEVFKKMSAHGVIDGRRHYQGPVNIAWRAKTIIASNDLPRFVDPSGAMRRRVILLPAEKQRAEHDFDRGLIDACRAELGAFAAQCITAAQRARQCNGYPTTAAMQLAYEAGLSEVDTLHGFVHECCVLAIHNAEATDSQDKALRIEVQSSTLYQAFRTYCEEQGVGNRVMSNKELTRRLKGYAFWRITTGRNVHGSKLEGIGLASAYPTLRTGADAPPEPEPPAPTPGGRCTAPATTASGVADTLTDASAQVSARLAHCNAVADTCDTLTDKKTHMDPPPAYPPIDSEPRGGVQTHTCREFSPVNVSMCQPPHQDASSGLTLPDEQVSQVSAAPHELANAQHAPAAAAEATARLELPIGTDVLARLVSEALQQVPPDYVAARSLAEQAHEPDTREELHQAIDAAAQAAHRRHLVVLHDKGAGCYYVCEDNEGVAMGDITLAYPHEGYATREEAHAAAAQLVAAAPPSAPAAPGGGAAPLDSETAASAAECPAAAHPARASTPALALGQKRNISEEWGQLVAAARAVGLLDEHERSNNVRRHLDERERAIASGVMSEHEHLHHSEVAQRLRGVSDA